MTRIIADISVSLDGFVAGPDPSPDNGLGTGGEALYTRAFPGDPGDRRFLRVGPPARAPLSSASPRSSQWSMISTSTATHLVYDVSR